jgi:hypothetical protein
MEQERLPSNAHYEIELITALGKTTTPFRLRRLFPTFPERRLLSLEIKGLQYFWPTDLFNKNLRFNTGECY